LLVLGILLFHINGFSQENVAKPGKRFLGFRSLNDTINNEKQGIFVLPLIYFTPDTRWAFGAAGVYYFKIPSQREGEKETRVSNIQFLADYTQNKQLDLWGQWNIFTRNENFLFKGEVRFRNFPDRFYGIGNSTFTTNEELYEYNLFSIKSLFLKKIRQALFVGIDYHFEREYNFSYQAGGILENGTIIGYNGGTQSGVGIVGIYDSRDNVINTHTGSLIELSSYFYSRTFGSTFNFTYLNGLYQKFWQLKRKNHIIGMQARLRLGFGDVPFLDLSTVGNDDLLRGYPKNRYRDVHFSGVQAEYRLPLFWRLGMVGFAGAGEVFSSPSDLSFKHLKYSYGIGLRFAVNPAERLNIRMDYAFGKDGGNFYFIVAEAF